MATRTITKKNEPPHFVRFNSGIAILLICVLFMPLSANAGPNRDKMIQEARRDLENADPFMGDWRGSWNLDDGTDEGDLAVQVIALGKGTYKANFNGEFDYFWPPLFELGGRLEDSAVQFNGKPEIGNMTLDVQSKIEGGKFSGKFKGIGDDGVERTGKFSMEKVFRLSPTLGQKPPEGAIVLFDGKNFNEWQSDLHSSF